MIVPQYWAEARIQSRIDDRQVTVKRFGWSDTSQADAERHADERAREAITRIESGEDIRRRERKLPYNGADGLPIREEIVARHNEVIVTRNSYGALCLNTPDVLFADIDFEVGFGVRGCIVSIVLVLISAALPGLYFHSWASFACGAIAGTLVASPASAALLRIFERLTGDAETRAMKRIAHFSAANPAWRLRVYRTPAGYRVLAMHQCFEPHGDAAQAFLRALGTDPIYIRMCLNQRCFRARVSPKPWRIGIASHLKPRPGIWPIKPELLPTRLKWVEDYESIARGYASCRFEREFGSAASDPGAEFVRELHDEYCQASSALPIA